MSLPAPAPAPPAAPPPTAGSAAAAPELKHDPHRWRARSINSASLFKVMFELVTRIPDELGEEMGALMCRWTAHLLPQVIGALKSNIRVVRPGLSPAEYEAIAQQTFINYGLGVKDYFLKGAGKLDHFEIGGVPPPSVMGLINGKQGFLIASAHFGNFEIGTAMMQRFGVPGAVMALPEEVAAINEMRVNYRIAFGTETLVVGSDIETFLKAKRDLANGHALALLVDRHLPKNSLPVQFFGRTCHFMRTPALLARHAGVPIVPIAILRTGRGIYHVEFGEAIKVPGRREEEGLITAMQQAADFFAIHLRRHPDHWFNFYDYFAAAAKPD